MIEGTDSTEPEEDVTKELAKIKGDAIGDTLYSERWVLRMLIKLSELTDGGWDADFEQMLCDLWDMTAEKDVVTFLLMNNMYDVFGHVVRTVTNDRCIEIMVGILGNMCCVEAAREALAEHNVSIVVINLITSQDSLVLIQVIRLLNSCLWNVRIDDSEIVTRPSSPTMPSIDENAATTSAVSAMSVHGSLSSLKITEKFDSSIPWLRVIYPEKELILRHLVFFLSSAVNEELLCSTLELLDTLLAIPVLKLGPVASSAPELASGLAECLRQLLKVPRVGDSVCANRRLWRAVQVWIGLVGILASCQRGRVNLGQAGDVLTKCFTKLVILLTTPEALKTQEPEMATLCLCVLEVLPSIQVTSPVLSRLTVVLFKLNQDLDEGLQDIGETGLEVRNLLHRGVQFLKKRLEESDDLVPLLSSLAEPYHAFLLAVADQDNAVKSHIERALLQIRTNGLVQ